MIINMATKSQRVAVVGAGVGGLASIKTCLEEGMEVVAFESRPSIGGVWSSSRDKWNNSSPKMYSSLITNTSKSMTCFSDFPFPANFPPYLPHYLFLEYLQAYAQHFKLLAHIKFNVRVEQVAKATDYDISGRWKLTLTRWTDDYESYQNKDVELDDMQSKVSWEEEFDGVIIAAGFFCKAKSPDYPGLKTKFNGTVSHACSYQDSSPYKDKTVLVVGNQHSSFDIACDLANTSKQVYLSVGDGASLLSRVSTSGLPLDLSISRLLSYLTPSQLVRLANFSASRRFDHKALGLQYQRSATFPVVVNDTVHSLIICGKVKTIGHLKEFDSSSATSRAGQKLESIDHVIFATGYERDLSFLDPSLNLNGDKIDLYKQVFPVFEKQHTLALVGCIRIQGPLPPSLELQARLAVYTLSGRSKLPSLQVMKVDSERYNRMARRSDGTYRYSYPSIMILEELAAEIGVTPHFWKLVWQGKLKLAFKTILGPAVPPVYRLMGPGSWTGAEAAIYRAVRENRRCINDNETLSRSCQTMIIRSLFALGFAVILKLLHTLFFSESTHGHVSQ